MKLIDAIREVAGNGFAVRYDLQLSGDWIYETSVPRIVVILEDKHGPGNLIETVLVGEFSSANEEQIADKMLRSAQELRKRQLVRFPFNIVKRTETT